MNSSVHYTITTTTLAEKFFFLPVCVLWCAFKWELLVYTFLQPLNWQRWILFLFSGRSPSTHAAPSSSSFIWTGSACPATSWAALSPTFLATSFKVSVPSAVAVNVWLGLLRCRPSSGEDGGVREVTALSWAWWTPSSPSEFSSSCPLGLRTLVIMPEEGTFCRVWHMIIGGGLGGSWRWGRLGSRESVKSSSPSSFR